MEFTKNAKKQLANATSKEEFQNILNQTGKNAEEAGVILSDEDLNAASGGEVDAVKVGRIEPSGLFS